MSVGTSPPAGAYTRFNAPTSNNQILARVGVSFIGVDQACSNAQKEVIVSATELIWPHIDRS